MRKPDFEYITSQLEEIFEEKEAGFYIAAKNGNVARGFLFQAYSSERTDLSNKNVIQRSKKVRRRAIDDEKTAAGIHFI